MIKDMEDSFLTAKKEVIVESNGKKFKFFATEIGYISSLNITVQAGRNDKNALAMMVAESITDEKGERFTYEEVLRLKKEFAEPLFDAVTEVNKFSNSEQKKT